MATQLTGSVRMAGDVGRGVEVRIHLEDETLTLAVAGGADIGTWALEDVGIFPKPDGFHLRLEGETVVLSTDNDALFATALGVSAPTNRLARQMAVLRDSAPSVAPLVVDLTDSPLSGTEPPLASRRTTRSANGLAYLGPLVVLAATMAVVASIVAIAGGSAISFPGDIPAWPTMSLASVILVWGGFAAFQNPTKGRLTIASGIVVGLLTILLSAGRLTDVGLAGEALLAFSLATVVSGVLLAIDTAGRSSNS